jgi:hypothetical protein
MIGRDGFGEVRLGRQALNDLVEQGLQHTGIGEPALVAGDIEIAVDGDPVNPVLDGELTDRHGGCVIGKGDEGHIRCIQGRSTSKRLGGCHR